MRLVALTLLGFFIVPLAAGEDVAQERYEPLYKMDAAYETGSITESYMKAYRSHTLDVAIKAWEEFIGANPYDEESEVVECPLNLEPLVAL